MHGRQHHWSASAPARAEHSSRPPSRLLLPSRLTSPRPPTHADAPFKISVATTATGTSISTIPSAQTSDCIAACRANPDCVAFVFTPDLSTLVDLGPGSCNLLSILNFGSLSAAANSYVYVKKADMSDVPLDQGIPTKAGLNLTALSQTANVNGTMIGTWANTGWWSGGAADVSAGSSITVLYDAGSRPYVQLKNSAMQISALIGANLLEELGATPSGFTMIAYVRMPAGVDSVQNIFDGYPMAVIATGSGGAVTFALNASFAPNYANTPFGANVFDGSSWVMLTAVVKIRVYGLYLGTTLVNGASNTQMVTPTLFQLRVGQTATTQLDVRQLMYYDQPLTIAQLTVIWAETIA